MCQVDKKIPSTAYKENKREGEKENKLTLRKMKTASMWRVRLS